MEQQRLPSGFHWRPARQRREQKFRAEARRVQGLLKGFDSIINHRGCQLTSIGLALKEAFTKTPVLSPAHVFSAATSHVVAAHGETHAALLTLCLLLLPAPRRRSRSSRHDL